jgi:class 3 adenylate cyclase
VSELTAGVRGWCEIEAPYEAADARVLLGRVLHAEGDGQGARLEWEVARTTFAEIGADVDAAAVVKLLEQSRSGPRNTEERTFLFSDIVGSTRLAEAMGDESWEALLAWHDRTLRSIFEQYAGWEVKHAGDGFFVAFADADAAMACAAARRHWLTIVAPRASPHRCASACTVGRPRSATATTTEVSSTGPLASRTRATPARWW